MEERLSMSDIQKMDAGKGKGTKEAGDESLLLETAQVFSLSSKELHYLELNDANNIPFPFEIKQKVHELIEEVHDQRHDTTRHTRNTTRHDTRRTHARLNVCVSRTS
jgi:hypothetical protein